MTGRVIQGFFVGSRPGMTPVVPAPMQPKVGPRPPGPPAPAFAGPAPVAQRYGASDSFAVDPGRFGLVSGGGRPLPDAVRGQMEAALGAEFSAVRVHIGPQAERVGAIAFTSGNDIYFAPGRFQPDTVQGKQLLGHELAHVVQQRQGRVRNSQGRGIVVVQDRALEAEADRLGHVAAMARLPMQRRHLDIQRRSLHPLCATLPKGSDTSPYSQHFRVNTVQLKGDSSKKRVEILKKYSQTVALFTGSKGSPVKAVKKERVVEILFEAAKNNRCKTQANEMLNMMQESDWCITAGIHSGGLGGGGYEVDEYPHITVHIDHNNYHLRVEEKNGNLVIWDIAGADISLTAGRIAGANRTSPKKTSEAETLMAQYELTEQGAIDAIKFRNKQTGRTDAEAVAWVRSGKPDIARRSRDAYGSWRAYHYQQELGLWVLS